MVEAVSSADTPITKLDTGTTKLKKDSLTNLSGDFDNFLLLLTTQLKNQDPTAPLDTNQFTQQLVGFAGVEQAIATNTKLDEMITLNKNSQASAAVSYMGANIEAEGDNFFLKQSKAEIAYDVAGKPDKVAVTIKNPAGITVFSGVGKNEPGKQTVTWDGKDKNGSQLPDGQFKVEVSAIDSKGSFTPLKTYIKGQVTAVDMSGSETNLVLQTINIPISKVRGIS